jgi:hypothetical protein
MSTAVKKLRGASAAVTSWNVNAPAPASNFLSKLEEGIKKVSIESVKTAEPFISLLPIREEVLAAIIYNMRIRGYDQSQPLIIWKEQGVLVDGHTRLKAAKAIGFETVPVVYTSFKSESEAISYMLQIQLSRRNIRDWELVRLAAKILKGYNKASDGAKADYLTKHFIGISATKAKKIYFVAENASDDELTKLDDEKVTINKLFNQIKKAGEQGVKKVHVDFLEIPQETDLEGKFLEGKTVYKNKESVKSPLLTLSNEFVNVFTKHKHAIAYIDMQGGEIPLLTFPDGIVLSAYKEGENKPVIKFRLR